MRWRHCSIFLWIFLTLNNIGNSQIQLFYKNDNKIAKNYEYYTNIHVDNKYECENDEDSMEDCQCSNSTITIPCNNNMVYFPLKNCTIEYCSNQTCNYMITPNIDCPNIYYELNIHSNLRAGNNASDQDQINVFSDNHIDKNISSTNNLNTPKIVYSSQANVTINFFSTSKVIISSGKYFWIMELKPIVSNIEFINVELNGTNPTFAIWLDEVKSYTGLKVCSPNTDDLDIFISFTESSNLLKNYLLYDSDDLNTFITTLNSNDIINPSQDYIPRYLASNFGCITIFRNENSTSWFSTTALFRMSKIHTKNCETNNIIEISNEYSSYSRLAKNNGSCELIFLSSIWPNPTIAFSYINTTSSKLDKFTFKSAINNRIYFDLYSGQAREWYNFGISTPALSITIPASNEISITASCALKGNSIYTNNGEDDQSGIIASESYSGITNYMVQPQQIDSETYAILSYFSLSIERNITFEVKEIFGDTYVLLQSPLKNYKLSKGQKLTLSGIIFNALYFYTGNATDAVLIQYFIEGVSSITVTATSNIPFISSSPTMPTSSTYSTSLSTPLSTNLTSPSISQSRTPLVTTSTSIASSTTPYISPSLSPKWWIIGMLSIILVFLAILIIFYFLRKRNYQKKHEELQKTIKMKMEMSPLEVHLSHDERLTKQLESKNVVIDFDNILGKGANATVYKVFIKSIKSKSQFNMTKNSPKLAPQLYENCYAAIKLPTSFNNEEVEQFVRELDALISIGSHPNIITFIGWTLYHDVPALITELADTNLLSFVKSFRGETLPYKNLISILWQISQALKYINSLLLVHRDVACRNILLSGTNIAKLADFGLCCHCDESFTYRACLQKKLPLKWLSIETLIDRIFSEKSDVWSFGIMCYEIFSFGSVPYATLSNEEMLDFLQAGNRLENPPGNTSDSMYELMLNCWKEKPSERPTFEEIENFLRVLLENETASYGYLTLCSDEIEK